MRNILSYFAGALFALLVVFCASQANASDDLSAVVTFQSKHFGNDYGYNFNEKNTGFGLQYNGYGILYYKNSYYKNSTVIYRNFDLYQFRGASFGGLLGITNNYHNNPVSPFAMVYIEHSGIVLGVLPSFLTTDSNDVNHSDFVVMFGMRFVI